MGKNIYKYLLYSVSAIFYIFAVIAIINGFYDAMFFLIMDGILFGVAGYYVGKIMEEDHESKEHVHVELLNRKTEAQDEIERLNSPIKKINKKRHRK